MVCHYTHCHVRLFVLAVSSSRQVADYLDDGLEHVGVIVRAFALHSHAQTFESHTRVDNLSRQGFEASVRLAVILHEHEVPDFDNLRMVMVHQLTARHFGALFFRTQVDMDFRARTARTRVAHLPEVVMLVSVDDVVGGHELFPVRSRLVVALQPFGRTAFEHGGIEVGRVYLQHVYQELPCPTDGFFLEIVAE